MNGIAVTNLTKRFGASAVLDHVTFTVPSGSFTCLLGPSGSGKSTLLGCLAGLVESDSGTVMLDGNDITALEPHRRPFTLVLQSAQLFPFLTVGENVAFGLRVRHVPARDRAEAAERFLSLVGLAGMANRSIKGLSGGEQQRVALARALAIEPVVLLLDEPLVSLDPPVRRELQDLLADIHRRTAMTMLLVTHDIDEAIGLADQLVMIDAGRIIASGAAGDLYERPRSVAAARLLGCSNVICGTLRGNVLETVLGEHTVLLDTTIESVSWVSPQPRSSTWVIRPEHVDIAAPDGFPATVVGSRYRGSRTELQLDVGSLRLTALVHTAAGLPRVGDAVFVRLPERHLVEVQD